MCFSMSRRRIKHRFSRHISGAPRLWIWCVIAALTSIRASATPTEPSIASTAATPARVVTLTPHATELVFAAGAGGQIVGTVASSDFPLAAKSIARVGDGLNTSVEQVLALRPDWVIGWPSPLMSQLQSLGIETLQSEPGSLAAIGQQVLDLGAKLGTLPAALAWHLQFEQRLSELDALRPAQSDEPVNVVVLASSDGQFVLGRHALMNETLEHCGATNPFAQTQAPAPQISRESLIAAKPDVIISGRPLDDPQSMKLTAPLRVIDADSLYRPGPRFIDAAFEICQLVQQTRHKQLKR